MSASLDDVLAVLLRIEKQGSRTTSVTTNVSASGYASRPSSTPEVAAVAPAHDLDGEHGDPTIKYDPKPKYWSGESFVGYRFSETSAPYLTATAKYLDACAYMAEKDADEKKQKGAKYKRLDAARARGWALRLENGGGPVPAVTPGSLAGDDEVPF